MNKWLVVIALALSGCASPSPLGARVDRTIPAIGPTGPTSVVAAPDSSPPRPDLRALAPALIVSPEVAALVDSRLASFEGHAAIVVADGASGEDLLAVDADAPVFAASLYKLAVLLEAERRIDEGTLGLDDRITVIAADQTEDGSFTAAGTTLTVDEALERAIAISDNASALALIRRLGVASIHATLAREGIALRFTPDGALTTARAVATFFGKLVRGALVSRAASARMLTRLSRQRVVDRFPAALPSNAVIAHKTGNLGFATHDAGIIRGPDGAPIVLVVLTWDSAEQDGIDLIKEVAAFVYAGVARTSGSSGSANGGELR